MEDCNCSYQKPVRCKIRKDVKPACPPEAVISIAPASSTHDITSFSGCFVRTLDTNDLYYVDDKHRPILFSSEPLEIDNYEYAENPLGLRSKTVYDFENNRGIYYNKLGEYRIFTLSGGE